MIVKTMCGEPKSGCYYVEQLSAIAPATVSKLRLSISTHCYMYLYWMSPLIISSESDKCVYFKILLKHFRYTTSSCWLLVIDLRSIH